MIGRVLAVVGTGLGLGLLASHFGLLEGPQARRARKELGAAFRRIPLPHLVLHLPTSQEEFNNLDDVLCECALSSGGATGMSHTELLALLEPVRQCSASLLFPDVDWPPVHSDNPTIHQYWAIIDQRYRRLVFSGELAEFCGLGSVPAAPSVTNIDPRSVFVGTKPLVRVSGRFSPSTTAQLASESGVTLATQLQSRSNELLELVIDANEPGTYDLLVSNGPNPASSVLYPGALVVAPQQQE